MSVEPVLIAGQWRASEASGAFQADNPATKAPLPAAYPISTWADVDAALSAAVTAADALRRTSPEQIAKFLELYAAAIERDAEPLAAMAHAETALPVKPRLAEVELPRTFQWPETLRWAKQIAGKSRRAFVEAKLRELRSR